MKGRWLGTLLVLLACQACMSGTPLQPTDTTTSPVLSTPDRITLPHGQEQTVPGTNLVLGFDSVLVDERCPRDASCGTPGNAIVELHIALGTDTPFELLLNTGVSPRSVGIGPYEITLLGLSPWPKTRMPPPQSAYDVNVQVGSI